LNGTIPSHWSFFTKLQYVDFSANQLSGSLPIGRFTDAPLLYNLGLWNNKFTGTIPSIINQLPLLRGLYLSNNLLTGTIPVELGQLTELTVLALRKNALNLCPTANFTLASPVSRSSSTCAVDQQSVTSCGCASAWSGCLMDSIPACPPQAPVAETPIATPSSATTVWASSLIMVALFGMAMVLMA
jgi:Leucine-rich repeat (LRR) protein